MVFMEFLFMIVFPRAAVYASHDCKWHGVVELVMMTTMRNRLIVHYYFAELGLAIDVQEPSL